MTLGVQIPTYHFFDVIYQVWHLVLVSSLRMITFSISPIKEPRTLNCIPKGWLFDAQSTLFLKQHISSKVTTLFSKLFAKGLNDKSHPYSVKGCTFFCHQSFKKPPKQKIHIFMGAIILCKVAFQTISFLLLTLLYYPNTPHATPRQQTILKTFPWREVYMLCICRNFTSNAENIITSYPQPPPCSYHWKPSTDIARNTKTTK